MRVQNNSELEIIRFQNVGIWPFSKCLKVNLQNFSVHLTWTKEVVGIISDKAALLGLKKDKHLLTNLKFKAVLLN